QPMLDQKELSGGLQNPADLGEGSGDIWDCAQRPGGDHGINGCGIDWNRFGRPLDELRRNGPDGMLRDAQELWMRVEAQHLDGTMGVVRKIQARAHSDFQDAALRRTHDSVSIRAEAAAAHGEVY